MTRKAQEELMRLVFALGLLLFLLVSFAHAQESAQGDQCIANALAGGTSDQITIPLLPCSTNTNLLLLTASAANATTTPTLQQIGAGPALPIVGPAGGALQIGDISGPGFVAMLTSTGTSWKLLNPTNESTVTAGNNIWTGSNIFQGTNSPALSAGQLLVNGLGVPPTLGADGEGIVQLETVNGLYLQGNGSTNDVVLVNSAGQAAAAVPSGTTNFTVGGQTSSGTFITPFGTTTLSGSVVSTPQAQFRQNLAGTSTLAGNTSLALVKIVKSGDNGSVNNGSWNELLVTSNYGGGNFTGGRIGVNAQMLLNTASTANSTLDGLVGLGAKVQATVNFGGNSSIYKGALFGANPWCRLQSGATFYSNCVGQETDAAADVGSSVARFVGEQIVLTSTHGMHGVVTDAGIILGEQVGATVGVRNGIVVGTYDAQWPLDPNGYLLQAQVGHSYATNPSTMAGGVDLIQGVFSGVGPFGGGFAWRSPGASIDGSGRGQFGFGELDGTSGGLVVSTVNKTLSGTPTVAAGGTAFTNATLAGDAYGNIVQVTASGGVVSGVTVVVRGWTTSPPSNPVAFTTLNGNDSTAGVFPTGLTLNESWVGASVATYAANGAGTVKLGTSTDGLQANGSGMIAANGSVATALTSVGPTGSHTTVQEWLVVNNPSGVARYIPLF